MTDVASPEPRVDLQQPQPLGVFDGPAGLLLVGGGSDTAEFLSFRDGRLTVADSGNNRVLVRSVA